jgi:hypothetical protein
LFGSAVAADGTVGVGIGVNVGSTVLVGCVPGGRVAVWLGGTSVLGFGIVGVGVGVFT